MLQKDCLTPITDAGLSTFLRPGQPESEWGNVFHSMEKPFNRDIVYLDYSLEDSLITNSTIWNEETWQVEVCFVFRLIDDANVVQAEVVHVLSADFDPNPPGEFH